MEHQGFMVVTRFKDLDILVSQTELALDFTKSVAYQSTNRPKSCRVVPSLSFPYKSKRSRLSCLRFNIPQNSITSRLWRYYVIFSLFSISLQSLDTCCGIYIVLRTLCNSANRSAWIRRYVKLPEVGIWYYVVLQGISIRLSAVKMGSGDKLWTFSKFF